MSARSAVFRSAIAVTLLSLVTLAQGVACNDKQRGAIMLSLDTDMRAPKDVNAVSLTIAADDVIKFNTIARVDPDGEVKFPATIAIVEPDNPNATVRIRIIALSETTPRVLRDVRTTVPRDGFVASLAIPLTFVNEGSASGTLPAAELPAKKAPVATKSITLSGLGSLGPLDFNPYDGTIGSTCGPDDTMTVIDGECASSTIDSSTLPAFDPGLIGSNDPGQCFDVATCFGTADHQNLDPAAEVIEVDVPACRFPRDPRPNLNIGFATAPGASGRGECLGEKCIVPIDQGSAWTDDGTFFVLSKGVCKKLASGAAVLVRNVSASPGCTTKTPSRSVCQGGASSTDGGSVPDAATGAETVPVQLVKAERDSAIEVTPLGIYHAGANGLLFQPEGGTARTIVGTNALVEPWVSSRYASIIAFGKTTTIVGTSGETIGYVLLEGDAGAPQNIQSMSSTSRLTAVAATSYGVFWAVGNGTMGLVYAHNPFTSASDSLLMVPVTFNLPTSISLVSAFGHLPDVTPQPRLLVGQPSGKIASCDLTTFATQVQCSEVPTTRTAAIDALVGDPLATTVNAYALTPDAVLHVGTEGAALGTKALIDEPGNLAGTKVDASYLPRGVTIAGSCVFYSSPKGIEYVSTDGTFSGWLVDHPPSGGPAVSLRTLNTAIYYALYAASDDAPNTGGGVWRAAVPKRCLP